MGLVNIKFEVANEVQFSRAFETGAVRFRNLEKPLTAMADDFYKTMENVFAAEGAFEERDKWQDEISF